MSDQTSVTACPFACGATIVQNTPLKFRCPTGQCCPICKEEHCEKDHFIMLSSDLPFDLPHAFADYVLWGVEGADPGINSHPLPHERAATPTPDSVVTTLADTIRVQIIVNTILKCSSAISGSCEIIVLLDDHFCNLPSGTSYVECSVPQWYSTPGYLIIG